MKLAHLLYESPSGRFLLVILVMLYSLCVGPVNSASEPGTVTVVLPSEPVNLDPGNTSVSNVGRVFLKNVVETLTEINPDDSSITPRLAHSWKQIDKQTWHFFLRKGVKFHDGEDFNAEAAIFNIKRILNRKIDSTVREKYFNFKLEGKVLDSHTLEIKMDRFEPLLPGLMGTLAICSPNTPMDKLTQNPIGTGPYKFLKWDRGTQIILERFSGYWGKLPQVQKGIFVWRAESSVRAAMVLIGEADFVPDISLQDANRPDMDISYLNADTSVMKIVGEAPLNDRRVRMALNYAIDRAAIRGTILSKDVIPATQIVVPGIFGHNPDLKAWPYDPKKARQLLNEARKDSVPVDKEIVLIDRIGLYPSSGEVMEAVLTMYKAVGLNVKLKMLETGSALLYGKKPFPPGPPYLVHSAHDNNKGDAVFSVFRMYHCKGGNSPMCDKAVDDLIEKAQVAMGEERKNLWRAAFKRIHEEIIPEVLLFHMVGYSRVGKRISFKPSIATSGEIQLEQMTFRQ